MKFEELHNDKETNDEYLLNTVQAKMMIQKKQSESYY